MEESLKQYLLENLYTDEKDNLFLYLDYKDNIEKNFLLEKLSGSNNTVKLDIDELKGLTLVGYDDYDKRLIFTIDCYEDNFNWKFKNFIPAGRIETINGFTSRVVTFFKPKEEDS